MPPTTYAGTNNGSLVINFNGQTVTVNGHFTGRRQTGVERINFNDGTFEGYLLERTTISSAGRSEQPRRGGVNLSARRQTTSVVGETGVNDTSPAAAATT